MKKLRENQSEKEKRIDREKNKDAKKMFRENQSEGEKRIDKEKSKDGMKMLRENQSEKERRIDREKNREGKKNVRKEQSEEERLEYNKKCKERMQTIRNEKRSEFQRLKRFRDAVRYGPIFVCCCCDQKMFRNNAFKFEKNMQDKLKEKSFETYEKLFPNNLEDKAIQIIVNRNC